jgi:5'-3' exonuclease
VRVHLIDGTYELFRSHFGAPAATAPDGREVGASRGLLRSMLSLLREAETTHVAIAFDHVIESFRNQLYSGYKTGEGIDPVLWAQFPIAERLCDKDKRVQHSSDGEHESQSQSDSDEYDQPSLQLLIT